jgi:hypothetical protein
LEKVHERVVETVPTPAVSNTVLVTKPESTGSLTTKSTIAAQKDTMKQSESRPPLPSTLPSQYAPVLHRNDISIPPPPPEVTTRTSSLTQVVKQQSTSAPTVSQPNMPFPSAVTRDPPFDAPRSDQQSERLKIPLTNTSAVPAVDPHSVSSVPPPASQSQFQKSTSDSSSSYSHPYPSQHYPYPPSQQYQHPYHLPAEGSAPFIQPQQQQYHPYPPPFGAHYHHPHASPYHHSYPPSDPAYPYAPPPPPHHHPHGAPYYAYPYSAGNPQHYPPYNYPPPPAYHYPYPPPQFPPSVPSEHSQFPPGYYPPSMSNAANSELMQNKPVIFELIQELNAAQVIKFFCFCSFSMFHFVSLGGSKLGEDKTS